MKLAARILFLAALAAQPMLAQANTPDDFFRAVKVNDDRALKRMIGANIDPNMAESPRGDNGLIVALREDSMRAFELLVRHPAIRVDQPAANGNTALMIAAFKGKRQAVLDLIERGAAVNRSGWTPLHYAAAGGDADIATLLLDRNAKIDARAPTGTTPLMMAAQEGQQAVVRLLLALTWSITTSAPRCGSRNWPTSAPSRKTSQPTWPPIRSRHRRRRSDKRRKTASAPSIGRVPDCS